MKRYLYIMMVAVAALLAAPACQRVEPQMPEAEGQLVLTFGNPQTKATGADLADGSAFRDLIVLLCENGKILQRVDKTETDFVDRDKVVFNGLELGIYDVYAFANTTDPAWLAAGFNFASYTENSTIDEDQILKVLAGRNAPAAPTAEKGMLLIGQKTFEVGVGSNEASIPLIRPVASFNVIVNNHTDYEVAVKNLSFSNFNPSHTYLFDHDMSIPGANTYRALPAYAAISDIAPGASATAYSTLLYENIAPEYKLNAEVVLSSFILPKRLKAADLNAMNVGDVKLIVMVNPHKLGGFFLGCENGANKAESCTEYITHPQVAARAKELASDDPRFWLYLEKVEGGFTLRSYTADNDGITGSMKMSAAYGENVGITWVDAFTDDGSHPQTVFTISDYNGNRGDFIDNNDTDGMLWLQSGGNYLSSRGDVTKTCLYHTNAEFSGWFIYETNKVVTKSAAPVNVQYLTRHEYSMPGDNGRFLISDGAGRYLYDDNGTLRLGTYNVPSTAAQMDNRYYWYYQNYANIRNVSTNRYINISNNGTPVISLVTNNPITISTAYNGTNKTFSFFYTYYSWNSNRWAYLLHNNGAISSTRENNANNAQGSRAVWAIMKFATRQIYTYTAEVKSWSEMGQGVTASLTNAQINRIDKETGKVSKLEWMKRNEKINVVINIYYNDKEAVFEYYVDNTTWITPTNSEHQFN